LSGTEIARDQQDNVVEIGIVVQPGDPRLVGRAGMSGRGERHDGRNQNETNEPAQK